MTASAPLAFEQAPSLCRRDSQTGRSCAWWHGVWQYFLLLDAVASPWAQYGFYADALRRAAAGSRLARLLISGASDYGMLAVVARALGETGRVPEISVVDICPTPILLNRWYAERYSVPIRTEVSDILDVEESEPFDVICTHSFFGNFSPERHGTLVAKWHDLLRPGGRVITVNRIRPGGLPGLGFTPDQAAAFQDKVIGRGREQADRLGLRPEDLRSWAQAYTENYRTNPVESLEGFLDLFLSRGFSIEHLGQETRLPDSGSVSGTDGPSSSGAAPRVHLVAVRR